MKKTFVEVLCLHSPQKPIKPLYILLNGNKYEVDKSEYLGSRGSKSGGAGQCWLIELYGGQRHLFLDHHTKKFFVEKVK